MNQNFLGAPDQQDVRLLAALRQNLIPMITAMDRLQAQMQHAMSRGEAVDWPQVHAMTSRVTNTLNSMNTLINGGYKHETVLDKETRQVPKKDEAGNAIMNADGTPVLEAKEVTVTRYRDVPYPAHSERIRALHAFPIPPFPMMQGNAAGMANTLLRKRLEPMEEGWVEARLRKAAEFVKVPAEWEIEPKKSAKEDEKKDEDSDDDADEEAAETMPTRRVPGNLSEDDILTLWKYAHQEVFDQTYLKQKYPDDYAEGQDGGEEAEEDEEEDEEEEDDDDFEDVMETADAPDTSAAPVDSKAATAAPAVVGRTAVQKPPVHQAIPGLPVLPLGFMHKFMSTGEATGQ